MFSNQANSYWRKTLIMENEEKPSILFLFGFQRILRDTWANSGKNLGFIKYHMKVLMALSRGFDLLFPPPQPKLSFLSLIIS